MTTVTITLDIDPEFTFEIYDATIARNLIEHTFDFLKVTRIDSERYGLLKKWGGIYD